MKNKARNNPTERNSIAHGGDAGAAERRFGRPKGGWLDLSTGINPHAYPLRRLAAKTWRRLPERHTLAALARAAADCYGVGDSYLDVPAPGAQELIQWLPRLCPKARVAVEPDWDRFRRFLETLRTRGVLRADIEPAAPYHATHVLVQRRPGHFL
ncbi:MAG: threonine-phosphate decarboxylase, partial [Pseudomonadota bacterium]